MSKTPLRTGPGPTPGQTPDEQTAARRKLGPHRKRCLEGANGEASLAHKPPKDIASWQWLLGAGGHGARQRLLGEKGRALLAGVGVGGVAEGPKGAGHRGESHGAPPQLPETGEGGSPIGAGAREYEEVAPNDTDFTTRLMLAGFFSQLHAHFRGGVVDWDWQAGEIELDAVACTEGPNAWSNVAFQAIEEQLLLEYGVAFWPRRVEESKVAVLERLSGIAAPAPDNEVRWLCKMQIARWIPAHYAGRGGQGGASEWVADDARACAGNTVVG